MVGKLYRNTSDEIIVDKTLTQVGNNYTFHMKQDTNMNDPVFMIYRNIDMTNVNYCYVTELKRYYYIRHIETSQQHYILHCHVDVLKTYWNDIKRQKAIMARSSTSGKYKPYLEDNRTLLYAKRRYKTIPFSGGFLHSGGKTSQFILTLNGGGIQDGSQTDPDDTTPDSNEGGNS